MKEHIVSTFILDKYRIDIIQDNYPESPRTWCNLGTMVCFHNKYNLGDEHEYVSKNYTGWDEIERDITRRENVGVILPLYLYDHSGITMNTTGFTCKWDSGQVGFIFASKGKIREEYSVKRISKKILKRVAESLVGEVETYDQYLTGDVYGYRITDTEKDEEIDACWGFFGEEHCINEAKSFIEPCLENNKPEESEDYYSGLLYSVDNNQ